MSADKKLTALEGRHVRAKKLAEGVWLVGWLFDSQKSGESMLSALADLTHSLSGRRPLKRANEARIMLIKEQTLSSMATAIRKAISESLDDYDLAEVALRAFADVASLSDWDALESEKPN